MRINQYFGANPQNYAQFGLPGHEGIDIKAPTGSKIFAVAPGEVIRVRTNPHGHNYGIHVRIQHRDGYQTTYAHFEEALVRLGQFVEAGTVLGLADNTGNSFGSHLHLTLKKEGVRLEGWPAGIIDPLPYLLPLMGWQEPAGPHIGGWILNDALTVIDGLGQANQGGATLRVRADLNLHVPGGTMVIVDGGHGRFRRVRVARAAVGLPEEETPEPDDTPPPTVSTLRGWVYAPYLTLVAPDPESGVRRAVSGPHGVNLRLHPERDATNIGLLKAGSTLVVHGDARGNYLPVTARRSDFLEPVALPVIVPDAGDAESDGSILGWVLRRFLTVRDGYALVSRFGVNLRDRPNAQGSNLGLVKGYSTVAVAGAVAGDYLPVRVRREDVLNLAEPLPEVQPPEPAPEREEPVEWAGPLHDTTPGWILTTALEIVEDSATVGALGANLRNAPRRNAARLAFVPAESGVIVTGRSRGEYTPVRVDDDLLEPLPAEEPDADPQLIGEARIGLHAAADPDIPFAEFETFRKVRPSIIKVLSYHSAEDIRQLAADHPRATFVVRTFLDFGGRALTPDQFYDYTMSDVERALAAIGDGREVAIELHNEPNVAPEGLGQAWQSGAEYATWWLKVVARFRQTLPRTPFIYPGLSPGTSVGDVKIDHVRFLENSRAAIDAADGVGIHVHWSRVFPMSRALEIVDDYISRLRDRPLWITEASNNDRNVDPAQKAREYLAFWRELHHRPTVKGVTYFVASATNPDFAAQVWVGRGIADIVGMR